MKNYNYIPDGLALRLLQSLLVAVTIGVATLLISCEEFVNIDPPRTEVVTETVFVNDGASISAMNGIYSQMMSDQSFTNAGLEMYTGLSSDELTHYSTDETADQFYHNELQPINHLVQSIFWQKAYRYINNANALIEGIEGSSTPISQTKTQLSGEARFIRAFCHFYLVNLFGPVPYINTTDFENNAVARREETSIVYEKIIDDLLAAEALLLDDFSFAGPERLRPNRGAATALLARTYLYTKNWAMAEETASKLIARTDLYAIETDLNGTFLPPSKETIWQLKPVTPGNNTAQGDRFILLGPPDGRAKTLSLSSQVYNAFEPGDARKNAWIGTVSDDGGNSFYFSYKYKKIRDGSSSPTEYSVVFRLAEQYLIRAEARAHQNKLLEAIADVDVIRARSGLPKIADTNPSINQKDLLLQIEKERLTELFTEWGHRWLDLKRTERANTVLGPIKPGWTQTDLLYPVPQQEITSNPNLLPQNNGY